MTFMSSSARANGEDAPALHAGCSLLFSFCAALEACPPPQAQTVTESL